MSVYAVERLRQLMECAITLNVAPIITNSELTEQVERWMGDETSREAYRRELVFVPLCALMGVDFAVQHAGNMSVAQWEGVLRSVAEARAAGHLPELSTGLPDDHPQVAYAAATTFIFNQYRYDGAVGIKPGDVVLDCGACFGETGLWALTEGAGKVFSFEPNPSTFAHLERNARLYGSANFPNGPFTPVALAVGNQQGTFNFAPNPNHPGASCLDEQGAISVPMTTLDAWCEQNNVVPDFIKMDLEGGEMDALAGAEGIFSMHKPRFAICLYHKLTDMWEIPQRIKSFCPDYTFWCKKSAPMAEFVLFGR